MPISFGNTDAEILSKILAKSIWQVLKRMTHHDYIGLVTGMRDWADIRKIGKKMIRHVNPSWRNVRLPQEVWRNCPISFKTYL